MRENRTETIRRSGTNETVKKKKKNPNCQAVAGIPESCDNTSLKETAAFQHLDDVCSPKDHEWEAKDVTKHYKYQRPPVSDPED